MAKKQAGKNATLSNQLRQAVKDDGRSLYALAKLADIDRGNLQRFTDGRSGLSLVAIDRLANVLGCQLVIDETCG